MIPRLETIFDHDECEELNNKSAKVIHIATEQDGHNSGREYFMRPEAKDRESFITNLQQFSREAKIRRENHNVFQRAQTSVRKIYESAPSQALIVFLFAMVSAYDL